jgi:membrane associated rhomboid family serine protease
MYNTNKELRSLKGLRSRFERFCYLHRHKGIPNLMLYISIGTAIVYAMCMFDQSYMLYRLLCFDRAAILQGQVWRLFTYVFTYGVGSNNLVLVAISLLCYYSLGQAMENAWGTFRFNLFYLTGIVLMDAFAMIFNTYATVTYLNMSLFLGYATMYPEARFLFLFIIPVKAWIFAIIDLALTFYDVINLTAIGAFPYSLFPLVAIGNYFLFFGKDVLNVIPLSWRSNFRRTSKKKPTVKTGTIPFRPAGSSHAVAPQTPYTHRCTICGRTDVSNPELEFRYCSRCQGYHCYCEDHISNHIHIEN